MVVERSDGEVTSLHKTHAGNRKRRGSWENSLTVTNDQRLLMSLITFICSQCWFLRYINLLFRIYLNVYLIYFTVLTEFVTPLTLHCWQIQNTPPTASLCVSPLKLCKITPFFQKTMNQCLLIMFHVLSSTHTHNLLMGRAFQCSGDPWIHYTVCTLRRAMHIWWL